MAKPVPSPSRIAEAVSAVSRETGVAAEAIRSGRRHRRTVGARWLVWRRLCEGEGFGFYPLACAWGCDHSTIISARDGGWEIPPTRAEVRARERQARDSIRENVPMTPSPWWTPIRIAALKDAAASCCTVRGASLRLRCKKAEVSRMAGVLGLVLLPDPPEVLPRGADHKGDEARRIASLERDWKLREDAA